MARFPRRCARGNPCKLKKIARLTPHSVWRCVQLALGAGGARFRGRGLRTFRKDEAVSPHRGEKRVVHLAIPADIRGTRAWDEVAGQADANLLDTVLTAGDRQHVSG